MRVEFDPDDPADTAEALRVIAVELEATAEDAEADPDA